MSTAHYWALSPLPKDGAPAGDREDWSLLGCRAGRGCAELAVTHPPHQPREDLIMASDRFTFISEGLTAAVDRAAVDRATAAADGRNVLYTAPASLSSSSGRACSTAGAACSSASARLAASSS